MKKCIFFIIVIGMMTISGYGYLYYRWHHLWGVEPVKKIYKISHPCNDTLHVLMIGDSWAGMHKPYDISFQNLLQSKYNKPVKFLSKGKGGEKSRGIYKLLFEMQGDGTKSLFLQGVDYCILSVGINDAAANLGTEQFCVHYRLILDFLLSNNIRPVILEIPDVDIWTVFVKKPKKDLLIDFLKSTMTQCGLYRYSEYREALYKMLEQEDLLMHVLYVQMNNWNGEGTTINPELFMADQIHLNHKGYERLDTCIAIAIEKDLRNL